jgi:predicted hydrolase (HD superfamily)
MNSSLTKEVALAQLHEWVKSPGLLQHCRSVGVVMAAIAAAHGEDPEAFEICGFLHDADWELAPETHPDRIVAWVRGFGAEAMANAIAAHGLHWGKPYVTLMDKALVASDELTGLVCASAKVRPDGILELEVKSVLKRFQTPSFAKGVNREEVQQGLAILGVSLEEHVGTIIEALRPQAEMLGLGPKG